MDELWQLPTVKQHALGFTLQKSKQWISGRQGKILLLCVEDAWNCDAEFAVSDLEGFLGYSTSYLQSEQLFYLSR